jgi:hypothetical protein
MKARQGYARQEMVGQKIIESASSTSVLFIIRKKYVKLIIYAQGTFSFLIADSLKGISRVTFFL